MNFALFYNPLKDEAKTIAKEIFLFLKEQNAKVFLEDELDFFKGAKLLSEIDPKKIDCSIVLGGDGSILRMMHRHPTIKAPVLGVNMGSLGFLADTPLTERFTAITNILKGAYTVQNRMMMDGTTSNGESSFSVNEVVVHRAKNPSLVDLAIYVDNKYLNTFSADGVIFSTATGSTAYSLAAGGPIVTPKLDAFIITPICPHTITNRPIVIMPEFEIRVEYVSHSHPIEVVFDGYTTFDLATNDYVIIKKSSSKFSVVEMENHDYFSTLRTKLNWSGKLKV